MDDDIDALEVQRMQSEIRRNQAEAEEIEHRRRNWWRPTLLGVGVFLAMVASFADFFSNLYQVSIVDRDSLRESNARLKEQEVLLRSQLEDSARSVQALTSQSGGTSATGRLKLMDLPNAVVVMRWGPGLREVLAVHLAAEGFGAGGTPYAHGAVLGTADDRTNATVGLAGGQSWSGHWTVLGRAVRIVETFPRSGKDGVTFDVQISSSLENGRYQVTRSRGSSVQSGVAEVLLVGRE